MTQELQGDDLIPHQPEDLFIIEVDEAKLLGLRIYQASLAERYRQFLSAAKEQTLVGKRSRREVFRTEAEMRLLHSNIENIIQRILMGNNITVKPLRHVETEEFIGVEMEAPQFWSSSNSPEELLKLIEALGYNPTKDAQLANGFILKPALSPQSIGTKSQPLLEGQ